MCPASVSERNEVVGSQKIGRVKGNREEKRRTVGNASTTTSLFPSRRDLTRSWRGSGRRARRATAMLPWEGWERMRAMPVVFELEGCSSEKYFAPLTGMTWRTGRRGNK